MPLHKLYPENWVDNHADYLFNYTIGRVSDVEMARDLVQDTFVAGLKSAKNFKGDAAERTWLIAILKRKIIDHYRKSNSKKGKAEVKVAFKNKESESNWLQERVADSFTKGGDAAMENEELGKAIQLCIDKLPQKQAKAFTMKTIRGMDTEDICNALGISASNLWVIIYRARTALMGCLNENWF